MSGDFGGHSISGWSCDILTHKTTSPKEQPFYHYIHSHRLAAEMRTKMKNNLLEKKFLSCSFYLYRFRKYVSYGFPVIHFCNPGVHYETPCIILTVFNRIFRFIINSFLIYFLASIQLVQKRFGASP
jgi:hypothetical protein